MSIAEKILDEACTVNFHSNNQALSIGRAIAAMQSYADFFYWLGKEGLEVYDGPDRRIEPKSKRVYNLRDLYDDYLTNWKPKDP